MARETQRKPRQNAQRQAGPKSETVTCTMTKTDAALDNPRLAAYAQMGYEITDKNWFYEMVAPRAVAERLEREQHAKGIAQAERVSKTRDAEGIDSPQEQTISRISRTAVTVDELLSDDSDDPSGYLNP